MSEIYTVTLYTPDGGTTKFTKGKSVQLSAENSADKQPVIVEKIDVVKGLSGREELIVTFEGGARGVWYNMALGVLYKPNEK